jgi:YggT family protein
VVTNRLRSAGCRRRFRKLHEEQHLLQKATDRTMTALFTVILIALQLYTYVVIASAIFSWLYAFNIVNPRNQIIGMIGQVLYNLTEPVLRPIRRFMPDLGGVDISPVVLLLGIIFIQMIIQNNLMPMFRGL